MTLRQEAVAWRHRRKARRATPPARAPEVGRAQTIAETRHLWALFGAPLDHMTDEQVVEGIEVIAQGMADSMITAASITTADIAAAFGADGKTPPVAGPTTDGA